MKTSIADPVKGLYRPYRLDSVYYGPSVVKERLLQCLPTDSSKAFIITGSSLSTKTPVIKDLEQLLGSKHHAGTFSKISQHAPEAQLDEAIKIIKNDSNVDTLISVGGGSPIDSTKALAYKLHEQTGRWPRHLSIPTTNSAAEVTPFAGYTNSEGLKVSLGDPNMAVWAIFYDPTMGQHTPKHLFLSTAIRALDHAVELLYHPSATPITHAMSLHAIQELFVALPQSAQSHPNNHDHMTRVMLACYTSLGLFGQNMLAKLGLSHGLGYALGSPYGIPHGVTSCLTLAPVMRLKAKHDAAAAASLARIVDILPEKYRQGGSSSANSSAGDSATANAIKAADAVESLVRDLDLATDLTTLKVDRSEQATVVQRATGGAALPDAGMQQGLEQLVAGLWEAPKSSLSGGSDGGSARM